MIDRYKLLITGRDVKYFLKKLIRDGVKLYGIDSDVKYLKVIVDKDDYLKIMDMKTTYNIEVIDCFGVAKIRYIIRKYLYFLIGFFITFIIITVLSKMIFSIQVIHTDSYIRDIILKDLGEKGIKKYRFKVGFDDREKIKNYILNKEKDSIEWLEIEESGTKYIVRVERRKKNKKEKVCSSQNIVAKKDAMILSISADSGEVVKKKYDYVKKGDVIISGLIYNKEKIVNKKCAQGSVFGEVWYKVNLELPKKYREENVTGKSKVQFEFYMFDKNYTLFSNFKTYKRKSTPILKSRLLPFCFNITKYLETEVREENYNLDNVSDKAILLATSRLKNKLGNKDSIIYKKVLKKYEKNSKIIVEVFFKVKEDITDYNNIDNINIEEENKKSSEE